MKLQYICDCTYQLIICIILVGGCSAKNVLTPEAKNVHIYDTLPKNKYCEYIDEIYDSEANMLTFLIKPNFLSKVKSKALYLLYKHILSKLPI